jgi:hypothetical protein
LAPTSQPFLQFFRVGSLCATTVDIFYCFSGPEHHARGSAMFKKMVTALIPAEEELILKYY